MVRTRNHRGFQLARRGSQLLCGSFVRWGKRGSIPARRRHAWTNGAVLERTLPDGDTGGPRAPSAATRGRSRRLRAADIDLLAEHFGTGSAEPMIIGRGSAASAWAAAYFTCPKTKKIRFWCPIWSSPKTGRARPVGAGRRYKSKSS